jgi:cytosine/adenosine deaminase-related metal-dependent hydrolase
MAPPPCTDAAPAFAVATAFGSEDATGAAVDGAGVVGAVVGGAVVGGAEAGAVPVAGGAVVGAVAPPPVVGAAPAPLIPATWVERPCTAVDSCGSTVPMVAAPAAAPPPLVPAVGAGAVGAGAAGGAPTGAAAAGTVLGAGIVAPPPCSTGGATAQLSPMSGSPVDLGCPTGVPGIERLPLRSRPLQRTTTIGSPQGGTVAVGRIAGMSRTVIEGCAIATVDAAGTEHERGHVVLDGARIVAVGPGDAPAELREGARVVRREGFLATPGLVNCHHHMCQALTRGMAQDSILFEWLVELYPTWARFDEEAQDAAARAAIAGLLRSGCSLATDHHYLHPAEAGDLLAVEVAAARDLGIRFHPCRGSMDLGESDGGLPPDHVVEDTDAILAATEAAIDRFHDPSSDSMLRIAVAPCSPFTVTERLMVESAALARRTGVRLHTHLAETVEEDAYCIERHGCRPVEYLERLGWIGDDVWLAHCVHLDESEVATFGREGVGVAHCPSSNGRLGAGIAPVADLLAAGAPVGLGVDGSASNESLELHLELREALLFARLRGGPTALTARQSLAMATIHGARCLGREAEVGSLEPGKLADVALWDLTGLAHAGIADPVAALVLGAPRRVHTLYVQGRAVVEAGELRTGDEARIAGDLEREARRIVTT